MQSQLAAAVAIGRKGATRWHLQQLLRRDWLLQQLLSRLAAPAATVGSPAEASEDGGVCRPHPPPPPPFRDCYTTERRFFSVQARFRASQ